ncbi:MULTISPECIES: efflux RND transporter periplasmic adaptor subunit [Stenotrophomonas]|jgi:cobalt-zinc-cadmium efflux system membrane fusion protein|uniref:efflux RND transporter periplasmic adaptor subunit n=1 Tax=Stenotrophomonas TaxID=40323 RepID=UPI0003903AD3|nr:efflux RND transporter periplasmic adaptor subunit [Stenotrophomonas maltophilia]EQM88004.1 hemolysin secretion protein D [Stenotrophomonas maltophilia MF89]OHY71883.1 efflux transporter periplasmic adaptor subunit [Stenotrophomonas maltophilia]
MNKPRNPILVGALLLSALAITGGLTGCKGASEAPATEKDASAKDDGHDHKEAQGEGEGKDGAKQADDHAGEEPGAHAEEEAPEGVVQLTADQIKASGVGVIAVGRGGGASTRIAGRVEPSIGARSSVAATVTGRVERVLVAPGSHVKANQTLAVVVSGDAATFRAAAVSAGAEAEVARLVYGRDKALVDQGVVARQEMETSRARSIAAEAAAAAARAQAAANGSPDSSGRVSISSPVSGIVGNVQVTPGGVVSAGSVVADVSNPDMNELVFTAPPALASQVAAGMKLEVTAPAGSFQAEVTGVAADIRQQGGTTIIRAKPLTAALPPAGSPISALVVADGDAGSLSVPADAVQTVDGANVVFVETAEGFKATPVMIGRRAGGNVEIVNGLKGDERIVGINAFLLKAELAKGEAEHGH